MAPSDFNAPVTLAPNVRGDVDIPLDRGSSFTLRLDEQYNVRKPASAVPGQRYSLHAIPEGPHDRFLTFGGHVMPHGFSTRVQVSGSERVRFDFEVVAGEHFGQAAVLVSIGGRWGRGGV